MSGQEIKTEHPCFNREAVGSHGRVHLPVAPACNIKCNYCDRRYDCLNESRPGVASAVLAPHQALAYLERVLEAEPRLSVAGIAGPGDPLANPGRTLETVRLVRRRFPGLLLCLSSNGLAVPAFLDELKEAGVTHMTITVNAVDPAIGAEIYSWVRDGKVVYRGREGAALLLGRQAEAIAGLKERGLTVKLNTIVIPGVNDHHLEEVAKWGAALGADLMNLMPIHPNARTPFRNLREPGSTRMEQLRRICGRHLPQMTHCRRCRADAVGLLGQDRSRELSGCLADCSRLAQPEPEPEARPYVAVASREGLLINLHLGQAREFQIWGPAGEGFELVEVRTAPPEGGGELRWERLARLLADCRMVLVSGIGETPRLVLTSLGPEPLELNGFIQEALRAIHAGEDLSAMRVRRKAGSGCSGMGVPCG